MTIELNPRHLHIVTHEIPWPANHGGLFDLFWKIRALYDQGILIHLHCFTKGSSACRELNAYCASINYYPRKKNLTGFSFRLPLIVNSRKNSNLLNNLEMDDHPILFEGIHTTYWISAGKLRDRRVFVRLHNAEFVYYHRLAKTATGLFRRLYYLHESWLLKSYERKLAPYAYFLAVNRNDADLYRKRFGAKDIGYLPVFLPFTRTGSKEGRGNYCLYHGNLAVSENEEAAKWLLKEVFNDLQVPFVIAGRNPSAKLEKLVHENRHTCLVANPHEKEMLDLVVRAQVNVLPSFNQTGIKLKLLNAFFNGRHCLVNNATVSGTGLEGLCHIANGAESFRGNIADLYNQDFTESERVQRDDIFQREFNNDTNARELIRIIWDNEKT